MKSLVFSLLIAIIFVPVERLRADNQIFLVRHAEKQVDGTRNPDLTEKGQNRAQRIAVLLKNTGITQIYSTNYQRTLMTAKPLAQELALKVELYDPRNLTAFAKKLKTKSGKILVVGHSNTTPKLATLLSGKAVKLMDESQYQHLYLVTTIGEQSTLLELSTDNPE